jgi:glycosyltransferase involved in cell wall biosynthesis
MNPDFSIITVSFNSEKTIERTIKSLLSQSHKNFEYIIIDGGSTDKTNEIITSYISQFNGNLTHISEPDNGIYDGMNKGIALTKGSVIGLLNSDDYYFDNTLSTVYKAYLESNKKTVISGELIFKTEKGEQLLRTSKERFLQKTKQYKNGVRHPATFVPKVIYNHVGLFNLDYKIASDAELMLRIYRANYDFKFIKEPLIMMYDGGASNSKGLFKQLVHENWLMLNTYCPNIFLRYYFIVIAIIRLTIKEMGSKILLNYRKIENK